MSLRVFAAVALLLLLALPTMAVKRHDFKTCQQSAFCRRLRTYSDYQQRKESASTFHSINPSSLKVDKKAGTLHGEIIDTLNPLKPLHFVVSSLQANLIRLQIHRDTQEQLQQKQQAFSLQTLVLANEQQATPFAGYNLTDVAVTIQLSQENEQSHPSLLYVHFNPLRIDLAYNGEVTASINDRDFVRYEQGSTPIAPDESTTAASDSDDKDTEIRKILADGIGSEDFNSHHDTKPFGPTAFSIDVSFLGAEHVYGIPEHAADFNLKSTRGTSSDTDPYRMYNLDVFEYELDNPMALYGHVPFLMSHKASASAGVFLLSSAEIWIDIERLKPQTSYFSQLFLNKEVKSKVKTSSNWISETGPIDLFLFWGNTPVDVHRRFTELTGSTYLPPLFSTAYHQCRWNYNDEEDVRSVDAKFDEHQIPYDVLWLDIEHTNDKRYFTWDTSKFPTPIDMIQNLATRQRKMVTIIDPHIKTDSDYHISKEAENQNLFVKNNQRDNPSNFGGWCWPGNSNWIDFINPDARKWWADKFHLDQYGGSTLDLYTWNDMNEPSVFTGPEITMPKDNIHHGGVEHRDIHNVYGMLMHRATHEGHLVRSNNKLRPFVLSRAFFAGTQRYGPIWTGDNMAQWDHLEASTKMLLSLGVGGITFAGADVGGFFNNPSAELMVRWYQVGALQPFFRAHAHIDTKRREPWLFGEPYTTMIRQAVRQRYRLLPSIYTGFFEAWRRGDTIMRPLLFEFPQDENTWTTDNSFMVGDWLLVKPVVKEGQTSTDVYLPSDQLTDSWCDLDTWIRYTPGTHTISAPLDKIPLFVRGGKIFATRERIRDSSLLSLSDPLTLYIVLGQSTTQAKGKLYVDDGQSFDYLQGAFSYFDMNYEEGILHGTRNDLPELRQAKRQGETQSITSQRAVVVNSATRRTFDATYGQVRVERIIVIGATKGVRRVITTTQDGRETECKFEETSISSKADAMIVIKEPGITLKDSEWTMHLQWK